MVQYAKYEDAAEQVYRILLKQTSTVQMLSCDEAFMDVTGLGDPVEIATTIRAQAMLSQILLRLSLVKIRQRHDWLQIC